MTDSPNDNSAPRVPPVPPSGDAAPTTPTPDYAPPAYASDPAAPVAPSGYGEPSGGQPGYQQAGYAPAYNAIPAAAPKTLSLIGMISGIVGVLAFGWFVPASIAALILGYMGKNREGLAAKGFWLTAIITGWIGAAITIIGAIAFIAIFALAGASSYSY